jgi:YHS domain-containing protein
MKSLQILFNGALIVATIAAASVVAEETKSEAPKEKKIEFKEQTNCPVMGGKINKEVFTDIQGQRVYHCCAGCIEPMKENPDKYFQKAAEQGVLFENIQEVCPVTGEKINKDISEYYQGRTMYFCCDACVSKFNKDPEKYLKDMDKQSKTKEMPGMDMHSKDMPDHDMKDEHEGHSH